MTTPQLTILTGASRGMGLAMATQLLAPGNTLLCISRQVNAQLADHALALGAHLLQWTEDLTQGQAVSQRLQAWLKAQKGIDFASANLINNAGVIPPIAPLSLSDPADLAHALRVVGKTELVFVEDIADMAATLLKMAKGGDVVMTMGAGSIANVPAQLMQLTA
jgi:NAD(P)-dependent dehydrogenase (short-subunit alcohol dehydrogenase family)